MITPVPPDIVDEESSSDTLANEGMRVLMNCKARGNPAPVISWKRQDEKPMRLCNSGAQAGSVTAEPECKEGTAFVLNNINGFFLHLFAKSSVLVHHGSELELPQVSRYDSGIYYCIASNGVPPTVSKRVRLYVDCEELKFPHCFF